MIFSIYSLKLKFLVLASRVGKGQDLPEQDVQNFLWKGYAEPWLR